MKFRPRATWSLVAALCVLLAGVGAASAQTVTTGSIAGVVTDAQGGVLPGATVQATHVPTGTVYEAVTDAEGRFTILNVRVGPYNVGVNMSGFKKEEQQNLPVALGEQKTVDFKLQLESVTETVTVVGESPIIDATRAGTADNISTQAIQNLPTISRNMVDFARTSPYFNPISLNEDPLALSVAGRNNRYNNVQIDGAVNNDVFGLSPSGTPGGVTEAQPISLDAIQELQLVVSPYDVRQGGFSGGGINAITKSGTNNLHGTGYYFGRNQDWVGESPTGTKIGQFSDKQFGGSVGGPIARNRAFFFGNVDWARKDNPSGISAAGTGQQFGRVAELQRFVDILKNNYGYDPGSLDEFIRTINSDKVFVRADFNISNQHRIVARHNYVDALNDIGRPTTSTYFMPDSFYRFRSETNSSVAQLNSTFGTAVNELRFTYQRIRDKRGAQPFEDRPFPFVTVRLSSGSVQAGRENFSTANELDQDVIELTDDYTLIKGKHTFTVGTHNEFFKFRNLFIRDSFGNYTFNTLDLFDQGQAQAFSYSFSVTGDPRQAARFKVRQYGVYAGDQWRAAPNFTVTYGVRIDKPTFPDSPTANPLAVSSFGFGTDVVPNPTMWSPRAGFNYDLSKSGREQVRGGVGLFTGRTPYVWLSNQYGNTGNEFRRLTVSNSNTNRIPFVPDANGQPTTVGNAATNEIDLIDPDYKFPSLIRTNLAYDRELRFFGLVGSAEFLYSKNLKDIRYENLNLVPAGTRPDGRPLYTRNRNPTISDAILLTNTDQGDAWSIAFKVDRPYRDRVFMSASYLYGRSRSILDGTSSQAASNWGNVYVPGDPNNPPLTRSNFDPGHRITISGGYDIPVPGVTLTASAYYSGQSGRPWSVLYGDDWNGDGRTTNDLLYIPRSASEVSVINGTFDDFMTFINSEQCLSDFIGRIHERNTCRAPWINTLDARVNVGLPFKRVKAEITWDILNVLNLLSRDSGLVKYANFNDLLAVRLGATGVPIIDANGKPVYNLTNLYVNGQVQTAEQQFTRADLLSRWQMQLGGRIRF
ncbi:MAG TPA: carboxypeptidase regulatory-like domain-containing protein [Vicinamibacterales bacterium]|nr:carboxypeptidase regulatory-like domain-containing protein [Vicinamibacterales bacterium]